MDAWTLLQLADSALPYGGFAHSGGLEAALQLGRAGAGRLEPYLEEALWNAGTASLPFVAAARAAPRRFAALDARLDAALPAAVANAASRVQGQAFVRAAAAAHPNPIGALEAEASAGGVACHLATAFGAALGLLGAPDGDTRRLFLFQVARGIASAAVRLGAAGPLEAQRLLAACARAAAQVLEATAHLSIEDAAASAPLLDLWQAHHDRLYSRLFRS